MSERELQAWQVRDSIEPSLGERIDIGFAQLMALIANVNRDGKKRQEPFSAVDFMPHWTKKPEPAASDTEDDGMAPERVMKVMEHAMRAQEVEKIALAARQRMAGRKP